MLLYANELQEVNANKNDLQLVLANALQLGLIGLDGDSKTRCQTERYRVNDAKHQPV
jgi:hypothetical protein